VKFAPEPPSGERAARRSLAPARQTQELIGPGEDGRTVSRNRSCELGGSHGQRRTNRIRSSAAHPHLQRLEPLRGNWKAEEQTLDSVLGPGVPVTSVEAFRWLDGGYFLVQEYETTFGDEPTQTGVNYWFYDAEADRFRIIFSNNGPFSEDGSRYEGQVAEGKLTFVGPARFQYDLDDDGRIKVNPDGTISIRWWIRDEAGEWQPWMTNTFSRNG
jgi:hypothetical protein